MKFGLTFVAALLVAVSTSHGHEAIFAWTYTTDLTPKGHGEFEQWITPRWEKEHGSYGGVYFFEEVEYGVADDFLIPLYVNNHYSPSHKHNSAGKPVPPQKNSPGVF